MNDIRVPPSWSCMHTHTHVSIIKLIILIIINIKAIAIMILISFSWEKSGVAPDCFLLFQFTPCTHEQIYESEMQTRHIKPLQALPFDCQQEQKMKFYVSTFAWFTLVKACCSGANGNLSKYSPVQPSRFHFVIASTFLVIVCDHTWGCFSEKCFRESPSSPWCELGWWSWLCLFK